MAADHQVRRLHPESLMSILPAVLHRVVVRFSGRRTTREPVTRQAFGVCFSFMLVAWGFSWRAAVAAPTTTLAAQVPGDVRLFVEFSDLKFFVVTPTGNLISKLLDQLATPMMPTSTSAPADTSLRGSPPSWRDRFARGLGLSSENTGIVDLLLAGRLALVADGWSGLGDAVLLAEPDELAGLLGLLPNPESQPSEDASVYRYRLSEDYELACDGRHVLVGNRTKRTGLYPRILRFWRGGRVDSLADQYDFRMRTGVLSKYSRVLMYFRTSQTGRPTGESKGAAPRNWWQSLEANIDSLALGVSLTPQSVLITTSRKLGAAAPRWSPAAPPVAAMDRLPASTILAWTVPINYLEHYQTLQGPEADPDIRFYVDVLRSGLGEQELERGLLRHLVGDSIVVVGEGRTEEPTQTHPALWVPTVALMVRTDEPATTKTLLERMAGNLLRLLNLQSGENQPLRIHRERINEQDDWLSSIPVDRLFTSGSLYNFIRPREICWVVVNGFVIVGTDRGLVHQLVASRRLPHLYAPCLSLREVIQDIHNLGGEVETILIARPRAVASMIDTWLDFVQRWYPDMHTSRWWRQLRQKKGPSDIKLGILFSRARTYEGVLEVAQTIPRWPAYGRLRAGDQILSVDGQPLDPVQKPESLIDLVTRRKQPDRVRLGVLRDGAEIEVELLMPATSGDREAFVPADLFRPLADLLRLFPSAYYLSWRTSPEIVHTQLELSFVQTTMPH